MSGCIIEQETLRRKQLEFRSLEPVILFVSQSKVRNYSLKLKSTLSPHFAKGNSLLSSALTTDKEKKQI